MMHQESLEDNNGPWEYFMSCTLSSILFFFFSRPNLSRQMATNPESGFLPPLACGRILVSLYLYKQSSRPAIYERRTGRLLLGLHPPCVWFCIFPSLMEKVFCSLLINLVKWRENSVRHIYQAEGGLTFRILHLSESQLMSSQGWNMPSVTQFSRITSMEARSNHVQEEVKEYSRQIKTATTTMKHEKTFISFSSDLIIESTCLNLSERWCMLFSVSPIQSKHVFQRKSRPDCNVKPTCGCSLLPFHPINWKSCW